MSKRPKRVVVEWRKLGGRTPSYRCPACHANTTFYGLVKCVTRFRCACGQELIAEHRDVDADTVAELDDQYAREKKTLRERIATLGSALSSAQGALMDGDDWLPGTSRAHEIIDAALSGAGSGEDHDEERE